MLKRLLLLWILLVAGFIKAIAADSISVKMAGIDDSNLKVISDSCSKMEGRIIGLTGGPNLLYQWKDPAGGLISNNIDLVNVGAGSYTLTYTDIITKVANTYGPVVVKDFKIPEINASGLKIVPSLCGKNQGSITGLKFTAVGKYKVIWAPVFNRTITYAGPDLLNAPPGVYELFVVDQCNTLITRYTIPATDVAINLDASAIAVTNETCGQSNGTITGLSVKNPSGNLVASWADVNGNIWGNTLDVKNLPSGFYTLTLTYDNLACPKTYGPMRILNTGGPVIDESKVDIVLANCICENGSITGITATGVGKLNFEWVTSQGFIRSTGLDLTRAKCDTYTLKVTDESGCGPSYSKLYRMTRVTSNPPSPVPDYSKMVVKKGTCTTLASVTGMRWAGTSEYYWLNGYRDTVSRTFDLVDVPSGPYQFFVTDPCGNFTVVDFDLGPRPYKFGDYKIIVNNICGNATTGSLKMSPGLDIASIRWVNTAGATVGTTAEIKDLPAGDYELYLTDLFGCEHYFNYYSIKVLTAPTITPGSGVVANDRCGSKTGSVKNIKITGGLLPYTYNWLNADDTIVGNDLDVDSLSAGNYRLVLTDASGCTINTAEYTISDNTSNLVAPAISSIKACGPGDVFIPAGPAIPGYSYRLYASPESSVPVLEDKSGKLKVNVTTDQTFYISQVVGNCESPRTAVLVSAGISGPIANTISPNGDGINDTWEIKGMENYPDALVQIFTRNGGKVFQTNGYAQPFNGTYRGKQLAAGTYFYIINLNSGCIPLRGSISILR